MDTIPRENRWGNQTVVLVSNSQQNVVFRPFAGSETYLCPLSVWLQNPLPRNLKPIE